MNTQAHEGGITSRVNHIAPAQLMLSMAWHSTEITSGAKNPVVA